MKLKNLAVLFTAVTITLSSCFLFDTDKKETSPLIGSWVIDSISVKNDSNAIGYLFLAMAMEESSIEIKFTNDSVFYPANENDLTSTAYIFDDQTKIIQFKDSAINKYQFSKINDSLISLTDVDSSSLFLHRLKK